MKYVVLFRGINVGGNNVVKMDDLKTLLLDLGLYKVKTYIQSGNAVFESDMDKELLQNTIQISFSERFGFESNVMIRNINEIKTLVEKIPIPASEIDEAEAADPKVEHLYIYFLSKPPEQTQIDDICKKYAGSDALRTGKRELYLLCYQSIRKSSLALHTAKVFDSATVRNWKTVTKLYEMLTSL